MMGKTYKKCGRLYPHERTCRSCVHKDCDLRDIGNIDGHDEKATTMMVEDQREFEYTEV